MNVVLIFLALMVGHFLADYPLQGDFLAKAKNRRVPMDGVPWWQAMTAHAAIHGGMVAVITGSATLGIAELVAHFLIDDAKCRARIGFNQDQAAHLLCKAVWITALVWLPA